MAALVIVPMRSRRRVATDTVVPEMVGVLKHVVRRSAADWRLIHEHFSVQVPPAALVAQAARGKRRHP